VLGEILKSASAVRMLVGLLEEMEIMAVIAIGHPLQQRRTSLRKDVPVVLLKEL
jgi:hypothetical protein